MISLEQIYTNKCNDPSDINEHLPTLKKYTEECEHVTEFGVRRVVSTYAFMMGKPKKLISYDIVPIAFYNIDKFNLKKLALENGVDFDFIVADVNKIEIEETDLLFIDTKHTYSQLIAELYNHSHKVRKYIILHDTVTFGQIGEDYQSDGLLRAVSEFIEKNPDWIIHEKFENNNGLTILKRVKEKKFCIHIHLYLTSQAAEDLAYQNLKRLKNAGFSIITTSPKKLPERFYEYIDYFFFDRENQLLQGDYEDINPLFWWCADDKVRLSFVISYLQVHSLAVLRSMIKGCKIAKILNIDYIIRFEYDDLFGDDSILKIKEKLNYIKNNNLDFYLYKNDYRQNTDISVHLMFYKADSFLSIFESIKNEFYYNIFLKKIGLEKKGIVLEQFLYELISKNENNFVIEYVDGYKINEEFTDAQFNLEQTAEVGTRDGLLSDVMIIKEDNAYNFSSIVLATQNVNCNENAIVYFDFYDNEENLISTITLSTSLNKQFGYQIIDINSIKNVKKIKIRHKEKSHHKTFYVKIVEDKVEIEYPKVYGNLIPEFLIYK